MDSLYYFWARTKYYVNVFYLPSFSTKQKKGREKYKLYKQEKPNMGSSWLCLCVCGLLPSSFQCLSISRSLHKTFEVFVFYIAVVPCFYNILIWLNTEWNYLWVTEANHMIDIHSFTPHTDDERSCMPCVQFGTRQRRFAVQLKRLTVKEATQNTNYHEHKIIPLHKSRKSNQR